MTDGFTSNAIAHSDVDFPVSRTASNRLMQDRVASAYDSTSFLPAGFAHFGAYPRHRPLPWFYPPTMLPFIATVALVPFLPAYFLFFAGSLLCSAFAVSWLSGLRALLPVSCAAARVMVAYPAVCAVAHGVDEARPPGDQSIVARASPLPIVERLNRLTKLPRIGPIVLLAVLFVVMRRAAFASRSAR
ncbi:hypothetical protein [Burkholderia metallica]|uniref:hypothetical protein n=1 Tax=Burkholderia metallica TaxID=488729 RepID=UPI001FC85B73|nr:hypothetical protein [Burkholderia metallica]